MEGNYKNREIDTMFDAVHEKLDNISVDVKEIKTQTTATNGRVNKHDIFFKVAWVSMGIIGTLITLFIPLYLTTIKEQRDQFIDMQQDLRSIQQTLINYDFEVI